MGMSKRFIGINEPKSNKIKPTYINISVNSEKINVVIGAISEIPSNLRVVSAKVALIANNDDNSEATIHFKNDALEYFSLRYSPKTTIPSVAKAESHREVSKIEYGSSKHITVTATKREVKESLVRENKYSSDEIISMKPALVTDTENPVRVI